ncbi:MAG: endolytic transglycosylase MltG, partial [Candidatus Woesebacteria bacterium]|nr:endolytic transglycosylase MltG [Candidatus Woesebacteria bacterium]
MNNKIKVLLLLFMTLLIVTLASGRIFFGSVGHEKQIEVFVVPQSRTDFDVTKALSEQKLIKNPKAFKFLMNIFFKDKYIESGGYRLTQSMNAWQIAKKITGKQDLLWVNISFCPRKEQVGEKLAGILNWKRSQLDVWNFLYENNKPEYFEGVYYPDTYLIPTDESEIQLAERFINRFNEKFAPYA